MHGDELAVVLAGAVLVGSLVLLAWVGIHHLRWSLR